MVGPSKTPDFSFSQLGLIFGNLVQIHTKQCPCLSKASANCFNKAKFYMKMREQYLVWFHHLHIHVLDVFLILAETVFQMASVYLSSGPCLLCHPISSSNSQLYSFSGIQSAISLVTATGMLSA